MTFNRETWIEGQLPSATAAELNRMEQGIADAHAGARKVPSCRLAKTGGGWSVADNGGFTTLTNWDIEAWDNDGMHDMAVNPERITFKTAGIYVCSLALNAEGGSGERYGRIFGKLSVLAPTEAELDRTHAIPYAGDIVTVRLVTPVQAAVGDYIYAQGGSYQKGSAASFSTNQSGGYGEPHFAAWKIGDIA